MHNNLFLIIRREYLERVRRKSFVISTILMPVFMIAMMALPALMAIWSGPENRKIAVIDDSGVIAPLIAGNGDLEFVPVDETITAARANTDYDAVLLIGKDIIANADDVTLYSPEAISMQTEEYITQQVSGAIENRRLLAYNIENLADILQAVHADVHITTVNDEGNTTSSIANYLVGMFMMLVLYMLIMLYGQMVMTSIIEEKNNRVLEIVVSSVKPTQIMLGKILGIGAVALTQIVIWAVLVFAFAQWGMPLLMNDAAGDADSMTAVSNLVQPGHIMYLFMCMTLLMIGGYLFYSSIYAAIGSAVDNIQDASQLQTFAVLPIIVGMVMAFAAVNDPFGPLAFWMSMIPFTSPMVMMARVPFGIPGWEVALSLAVLAVSVWFTIWLSAKIYRVGIFMYGKKPSVRELVRWARYK